MNKVITRILEQKARYRQSLEESILQYGDRKPLEVVYEKCNA